MTAPLWVTPAGLAAIVLLFALLVYVENRRPRKMREAFIVSTCLVLIVLIALGHI
jgi:hypothetical protein